MHPTPQQLDDWSDDWSDAHDLTPAIDAWIDAHLVVPGELSTDGAPDADDDLDFDFF